MPDGVAPWWTPWPTDEFPGLPLAPISSIAFDFMTIPALASLLDRHLPMAASAGSAALRPRIDAVRRIITEQPGDSRRGEPLFMDRCGGCHTLFFKGGKIGPDLTSYQRATWAPC